MFNPAMFESMKHMMNGNMMKQSADMMSKMSDEELKSYAKMTGMDIDPKLLRSASSSMANMDESTLDNMKNMAAPRLSRQASAPIPSQPAPGALKLKNEGNEFFKAGKINEAKKKYSEGIDEIDRLPLDEGNKDLEVTLRMNLCACLIKEENFDAIIEQCKKSLLLGENPKTFYRYGQALYKLGNSSRAIDYLEKAISLSPNDENISNLLTEVKSVAKLSEKVEVKVEEKIVEEKKSEKQTEKPVIVDQPKNRGVDLDIKPVEKPKEKVKEKLIEKPEARPVEKKAVVSPSLNPTDLKLPNLSPDQMNKGLEELKSMPPESIAQMANTLKTMDPRLMQEVFKSQGINMPPEQIAKMADMLTPDTIKMMTETFAGRNPLSNPTTSRGGSEPAMPAMPDVASMLNNPDLTKMASQMLSQQLGKQPEDIQVILNCIGKMMKIFGKIVAVYNILMGGNRKYITLSVVVLGFSYWLGYL